MFLYVFIYVLLTVLYFRTEHDNKGITVGQFGMILFLLATFVGISDMLGGYDRYIYCELFDRNADIVRSGGDFRASHNPLMGYSNEMAYVIWNVIVSHFTANRYIFVLITTYFVYLLFFISIKKYVSNYPFLLLVFMSIWFFFTFTYLRQVLATSFAWFGYKYVIERKFWKFAIIAYIVYKFHNSGIIYSVLYFVPLKKYSPKIVISLMALLLLVGLTGISTSLYAIYGDLSDTESRTEQYLRYGTTTRIAYMIEAVVFLFFILNRYKDIPEDRTSMVMLNASFLFCGFLLFFIQSSSAGRQCWYFMLGILCTLTNLATKKKGKSDFKFSLLLILTLLYLRVVVSWADLISPYYTFVVNNHYSYSWQRNYEYDDTYAKDKFYREPFRIVW